VAKQLTDFHTPLPLQAALARFIQQGLFARHLRKLRGVYRTRHEQVTDALTGQFAAHLKLIPSAVGLHLAATAPGLSSEELEGLLGRASAVGVELLPLSLYAVDTPPQPGLIFAYGAIPTSRIGEGLDRLRRCFDD
jgi:GntR family transcriptional regulator/MocR family aminotransferase